ncbi:MAG: 50S ribosomal protein L5 [Candidatus Cloacimonadota bacterium]|nr:MAG: 50S ribosomal protein L5 [Candidatus Cloacimonadota bacterium]
MQKCDLKEKYQKEVIPKMMEKYGWKNIYQVPKIEKVVVNSGIGKIITNLPSDKQKKIIEEFSKDLALITGQKPSIRPARKNISSFRLKKGMPIGLKVTLRRQRMYDFLARLIHLVLPRIRDFKGIDLKSFDKNGNLTIGIKEHTAFPEIKPKDLTFGLEITVVTSCDNKEQSIDLLRFLGFPLKS